jgi:hypothetical protein
VRVKLPLLLLLPEVRVGLFRKGFECLARALALALSLGVRGTVPSRHLSMPEPLVPALAEVVSGEQAMKICELEAGHLPPLFWLARLAHLALVDRVLPIRKLGEVPLLRERIPGHFEDCAVSQDDIPA